MQLKLELTGDGKGWSASWDVLIEEVEEQPPLENSLRITIPGQDNAQVEIFISEQGELIAEVIEDNGQDHQLVLAGRGVAYWHCPNCNSEYRSDDEFELTTMADHGKCHSCVMEWRIGERPEFPYGEFQDGRQWNDPLWPGQ